MSVIGAYWPLAAPKHVAPKRRTYGAERGSAFRRATRGGADRRSAVPDRRSPPG